MMKTTLQQKIPMETRTGIQQAVDKFDGSPSKLAAAVTNCGVIRQHVEHWLRAGRVPAEKCPEVAVASGIALESLNDRVNWALVRSDLQQAAPADVTTH
jgi:Putative antitoxin of bacterial toxin-antitoxin system, YdaS/YdaT